jgi:hypothetical protein
MHTTWRTDRDPAQVLDLLQERLATAEDVTAVDRDGAMLVVRSRDVPMWAHLLSLVLTPLPLKSVLMRARTDRVLRITATGQTPGRVIELDGDANAAVSKVLVTTSHELFPDKVAAWDNE